MRGERRERGERGSESREEKDAAVRSAVASAPHGAWSTATGV